MKWWWWWWGGGCGKKFVFIQSVCLPHPSSSPLSLSGGRIRGGATTEETKMSDVLAGRSCSATPPPLPSPYFFLHAPFPRGPPAAPQAHE